MFQYILLGLLGIGSTLSNFDSSYIEPKCGFSARYYVHNSMGRFQHVGTPDALTFNSYLRVKTTFTLLKIVDLNMSMQGWAVKGGFVNGQGGGRWGAAIRLTNNLALEYEHYSAHSFDNANLAGSYDYIGLKFEYGYDKPVSNLLKRIL